METESTSNDYNTIKCILGYFINPNTIIDDKKQEHIVTCLKNIEPPMMYWCYFKILQLDHMIVQDFIEAECLWTCSDEGN